MFVMLIGAAVLAGWVLGIDALKGLSGGIMMKANAAVCLILAGASLWLLTSRLPRIWRERAGVLLGGAVGAIGLATLAQHVFGVELGIDQFLFTEEPGAVATASPGRMGPPASACFGLAGFALVVLHLRRYTAPAQAAALAIALAALLALTGYFYGVASLYGVARFTGIALNTAIALLVLGLGLLAASADRGFAALFAGDGFGSSTGRRLLLIGVTVPLMLGWLRIRLEDVGYFDHRFGAAALVLSIIVVMGVIVARTAAQLNRLERQQLQAESALRDRLQEMETVLDVLPIGVLISPDPSGENIKGNRAAREFLRMDDPGGNLSLSAAPEEAPAHFRILREGIELPFDDLPVQQAARAGAVIENWELEIEFVDGTVRHELISARPLLDAQGQARGAVASVMDISGRRAADREREELLARAREAHARAEAANRSKDEFLATVSHELRTPLNAILGWASILRDGVPLDEPTRQQALATIERSCLTQAQLVDDLLDVSRIVAGQLRLEMRPVNLVHIVESAVNVVRPQADARGIRIRTHASGGGTQVVGDPGRLQQVVWNLLSNAVKFSPGGGTIAVEISSGDSGTAVRVTDEGVGIAPDFLPNVFDRFWQADGAKTRRHGGLGLGLSIARDLAEMHGGTLAAASEGIGRGAQFTLWLPNAPLVPAVRPSVTS